MLVHVEKLLEVEDADAAIEKYFMSLTSCKNALSRYRISTQNRESGRRHAKTTLPISRQVA